MTLFTAFNIQGDAYLVERRNGCTILVDGGENPIFGKILMNHIRTRKLSNGQKKRFSNKNRKELLKCDREKFVIDLIVCTHEDSDHTEGIISVLKQEEVLVKRIWLPVLWKEILCMVFDSNVGCHELKNFIEDRLKKSKSKYPDDKETEEMLEKTLRNVDDLELSSLMSNFGNTDFGPLLYIYDNKVKSTIDRNSFFEMLDSNLLYYISKVVHIASLSKISKGARIEWLKYNPKTTYTPVNANSIEPLSHEFLSKASSKGRLRPLGKINEESIVCLFKGDGTIEPDILFCADSNLKNINNDYIKKLNKNALVTVPHHGSRSNEIILAQLIKTVNKPIWVRGDSTRIKMGNTFLNLSSSAKKSNLKRVYCTKCRKYCKTGKSHSLIADQIIELKYIYMAKKKRGKWVTGNKICKCCNR